MFRYFIGFFITIGLLILLIVLLMSGGNNKSQVPNTTKTLDSYASSDAVVRLTTDGTINSDQEHRQIIITVGRDDATFEAVQGYGNNVLFSQTYTNTKASYTAFLKSLNRAGFTKGNIDKKLADYQGYCPLGRRYIFELLQNGKVLEQFWATSCGNPKTFNGNLGTNMTLFQHQIPDYDKLSGNIQL